jgi:hypothetical protein
LGQALARARWRRCFAFSFALRLFARIVLLDLVVLFTCSSDLDAVTLFYPAPPTLAKIEPPVGGMGMGFGEAEFAAHEINEFFLGAHPSEPTQFPPAPTSAATLFA